MPRTDAAYHVLVRGDAVSAHVLELLDWVSRHERTYDEAMEAWRTHCPRLSAWEDAIAGGLVEVVRWDGRAPTVRITPKARTALATRR